MRSFSLKQNNEDIKNHMTAVLGEILGTTIFLFLGEGAAKTAKLARTVSQTEGSNAPLDSQSIMMIATAFGLSLLVTAWVFYRITGGLFNPAITVALWLAGVLTSARAAFLFVAQLLGGIIASALVLALTPKGASGVDAVNTTVDAQISYQQAFVLEFLGTSVLVFAVLMLAVEKHRATYLAPIGIGLALFTLHLFLVAWTGCSLNPARSLGPAAVAGNFPEHHWIYWVAPITGGCLSVFYFQILKLLKYNSALLDQDSDKEVGGLRPVHVRVYRLLRPNHNQSHRSVTIQRRSKVVKADGSTGSVEQVHADEVLADDKPTGSAPDSRNAKPAVRSVDGGLPLPVTASGDESDKTVV